VYFSHNCQSWKAIPFSEAVDEQDTAARPASYSATAKVWHLHNRCQKKNEKRQRRLKRAQEATFSLLGDGCFAGTLTMQRATMLFVRGVVFLSSGLLLGGCIQSVPVSDANFTARDKRQLANPPYQQALISPAYQRQVVTYHRKDAPGSILVDTAGRYVFFVLPGGKAVRYGATVGEQGQDWSGVATVGRKEEWPGWTPTADEKRRLGPLPSYVAGGAHNPMGARALYLYAGGKDTLYRIHGTNQPEYIGRAISSGCIRLTNEDAIDLYSRVKVGATVVVLGPGARIASAGRPVWTP
jgi:lipoprotein-anchoring transpeptidase ErfK/SrfK